MSSYRHGCLYDPREGASHLKACLPDSRADRSQVHALTFPLEMRLCRPALEHRQVSNGQVLPGGPQLTSEQSDDAIYMRMSHTMTYTKTVMGITHHARSCARGGQAAFHCQPAQASLVHRCGAHLNKCRVSQCCQTGSMPCLCTGLATEILAEFGVFTMPSVPA